jgi:hypothetical protein
MSTKNMRKVTRRSRKSIEEVPTLFTIDLSDGPADCHVSANQLVHMSHYDYVEKGVFFDGGTQFHHVLVTGEKPKAVE